MYSTWVFVILGAIFGIFETCQKCSLGSPEQLWVLSSEPHVSFQTGSDFKKCYWKSIKSLYYSTWFFVNLGAIFGIFETCQKRSLGSPEHLWVLSSEPHVSFQTGSDYKKCYWKSIKSLYYSTYVFVNLGAIFGIFETCQKRSLGSPEHLWVVSSEAHLSFQIGSDFKNATENQLNPCTIVHGFCQFGCDFWNFRNLSKTFLR